MPNGVNLQDSTKDKIDCFFLLLLGGMLASHLSLVAIGNVVDYASNFAFVSHVLSMDTTLKRPSLMWRAVEKESLQHIVFVLIILWESLGALLLWFGVALVGFRKTHKVQGETYVIAGIVLGLILWFFAFIVIGGEWFAMWQSTEYNGLSRAYQNTTVYLLALLLVLYRVPLRSRN